MCDSNDRDKDNIERRFCTDEGLFCEPDDNGKCPHCEFDRALGDDPDCED
jgi:hypothetical protein